MSDEHNKPEIDAVSGVETTGHEWDGLKELNNPLPRWWLWVWAVCILWSIWYFVVYPAWPVPGGATKGTSGYTQYKELEESQAEIFERQRFYLERFEKASFHDILNDDELYTFAMAGGRAAFKENCAQCHGTGAEGRKGFPNLNDDDWLWGGKITDIYQTIQYGIRVPNSYDTRLSQMPSFGRDKLLTNDQINTVVDFVLSLNEKGMDSNHPGYAIFQENCASCHGANAKGMHQFGAPNLTDNIWLYGGRREDVYETVVYARNGVMPTWKERLNNNTIRQISLYVHQLGGGEPSQ